MQRHRVHAAPVPQQTYSRPAPPSRNATAEAQPVRPQGSTFAESTRSHQPRELPYVFYTVRAVAPHRCKEAPLPTAFISHNLTAYLRNASRAGDTINATMTDPGDGGFNCMGCMLKATGQS